MAAKQNDENKSIIDALKKKTEVISPIISESNEKIKRFAELILEYYEEDDTRYLQRHEFNQLRDIVFKESVYIVNQPEFLYKGKKQKVIGFNLIEGHAEMIRLNKLFFFNKFIRNIKTGDIMIHGAYVE